MMLRLRQCCAHPSLVIDKKVHICELCGSTDQASMMCLHEDYGGPHFACRACVHAHDEREKKIGRALAWTWADATKSPRLPKSAFELITEPEKSAAQLDEEDNFDAGAVDGYKSSTKISLLLKHLHRLRKSEPGVKVLVYSQWTSLLTIVERFLSRDKIKHVRLDGSMSLNDRDQAVQTFEKDPEVTVFALSLKAAGTGLNLVAATHVFLMDPWWNPAVEQQAFDRCYRIGQTKAVTVHRLYIFQTIEDRLLQIQVLECYLSIRLTC